MEGNALPSYVLYWGSKNGTFRYWEEFPSEPEAMKGLARRNANAPWHTYRIARILGSLPATADEPHEGAARPDGRGGTVIVITPGKTFYPQAACAYSSWAAGYGGSLGE